MAIKELEIPCTITNMQRYLYIKNIAAPKITNHVKIKTFCNFIHLGATSLLIECKNIPSILASS